MPRVSAKVGPGGIASARVSVLHPPQVFKDYYVNTYETTVLEGLKITASTMKECKKEQKHAILFVHDAFPGQEIWAFAGSFKLTKPGPPPYFTFGAGSTASTGT